MGMAVDANQIIFYIMVGKPGKERTCGDCPDTMEKESSSPAPGAALGRWWGQTPQPSPSTDVMNQLCRVCGEPAAGFHFGAFTCEGCKSFFGRTYNNLGSITECKNNGECVINKKNRTACKACRLRKCLLVGMSKSGSRYGRRSNWFKIHCLLQEQHQAASAAPHINDKSPLALWSETYNNSLKPPPFPSDSKPSPTDDNLPLNNNPPKDPPSSPNPLLPSTAYPPDAAAALWAARHSLFPLHLSHTHIPSLPLPFIPPFPSIPPNNHPPNSPNTNILLPFIHNFHSPPPRSHHQPPSPSPSPSRSRSRSRSPSPSHSRSPSEPPNTPRSPTRSPSPTNHRPRSPTDPPPPHKPRLRLRLRPSSLAEEHSLALLRSLGPMQDTPMDLSVRVIGVKHRRKSKSSQRVVAEGGRRGSSGSSGCSGSDGEVVGEVKDGLSEPMDSDENFNRRKTPLDLTKSTKVEI